ncbi:hypothetical protein JIN85_05340 [Luteolibacter pohnpeiensis]|uniref:Uncharacterized protein n=1 Tax=Luteolibacter pohnpeiensis TaxID=454153 RepID=A0A934VTT9_9BACT|nr:hypothetical protein [Luteolibacter pohnpeiensis]
MDPSQLRRQAIARCDTDTLWDWLQNLGPEYKNNRAVADVIEELIDRLGFEGAWEKAMSLDGQARYDISSSLVGILSTDDPWEAFKYYKLHRGFFDEMWGYGATFSFTRESLKISADKAIEVFENSDAKESKWCVSGEYPEGFDYEKLANYFVGSASRPVSLPDKLLADWAAKDPVKAAEWITANPPMEINDETDSINGAVGINMALESIVESDSDSRNEAIEDLAKLPQPVLDKIWSFRAESSIQPELLSLAEQMGQRDAYLVNSLLKTNRASSIDPSWDEIPVAERNQILDTAEQRWASESSSPMDERARQRWREMVEKSWAQ